MNNVSKDSNADTELSSRIEIIANNNNIQQHVDQALNNNNDGKCKAIFNIVISYNLCR